MMKTKCKQIVKACVAGVALASLCMACTQQSDLTSLPAAPGKGVTLTLPIAVTGMEGAETRAEVAKDAKETEIKTLWLLQFDGTDDNAKLLQRVNVTNWADNKITVKFLPSTKTTQDVYLVANTTPDVAVNTTTKSVFLSKLAMFPIAYGASVASAVPSTGLPMCGHQEFNPMTVGTVPAITLKAMVAKMNITVKLNTTGITNYLTGWFSVQMLCVANGSVFAESSVGDGAYHVPGFDPNAARQIGALGVGSSVDITCYFPENLAGRTSGIDNEKKRGVNKSPGIAMHIRLTGKLTDGKSVAFYYFLGAENNLNDFNVVRNHVYNVTMDIKGIFKDDERVAIE